MRRLLSKLFAATHSDEGGALAAANTRHTLESLIKASPVAITLQDLEGRVQIWNPAAERILGWSADEVLGKPSPAIPEEHRSQDAAHYREILSGRSICNWESTRRCKDGSRIHVRIDSGPVHDGSGQVVGGVYILSDISEQKRLDANLQRTQKLESLGILAGGIAHDFNNLLMSITGNAELTLMGIADGTVEHDRVARIRDSALRAAELCKQMLAYSGSGRFVVEPLVLSEVVRDTAELLNVMLPGTAALRLDFKDQAAQVRGDANQLRQVAINLFTNAAEALRGGGGSITVSTEVIEADRAYLSQLYLDDNLPQGTYVVLDVTDTGCGMDPQTKARIFDPFFTTKFTGRGLGMAAVLGIVRGHRGAIKVYSEPGTGTSIKVLLPGQVQAPQAAPDPDTLGEWRGQGTVLVADDEEMPRVVAKEMLELFGFRVLTAADGMEAVAMFREHADEVVLTLLDMMMPRMNGAEAFCEIRQLRPDVPVILMSGYSEYEATHHLTPGDRSGFLQKPFPALVLRDKVREALKSSASA